MANETLHPFELSGMGRAPFKCVGVYSFPSPSLAEQNPAAYQAAIQAMPRGYRCGTCHHCGMALMNNYLIESADGVKSSVGCECVYKTNDPRSAVVTEVKREQLRMERQKRAEKRAAQRKAAALKWEQDHPEQVAARAEEKRLWQEAKTARENAANAERIRVRRVFAFIIPVLQKQAGEFCGSIAMQINDGYAPQGRALEIVADIYAKAIGGRRGSNAYWEAHRDFAKRIEEG